jgi:hypothetical protein
MIQYYNKLSNYKSDSTSADSEIRKCAFNNLFVHERNEAILKSIFFMVNFVLGINKIGRSYILTLHQQN